KKRRPASDEADAAVIRYTRLLAGSPLGSASVEFSAPIWLPGDSVSLTAEIGSNKDLTVGANVESMTSIGIAVTDQVTPPVAVIPINGFSEKNSTVFSGEFGSRSYPLTVSKTCPSCCVSLMVKTTNLSVDALLEADVSDTGTDAELEVLAYCVKRGLIKEQIVGVVENPQYNCLVGLRIAGLSDCAKDDRHAPFFAERWQVISGCANLRAVGILVQSIRQHYPTISRRIPPVISSEHQSEEHHLLAICEGCDISIIPGLQLRSTKPIRSLWITWSPAVEFLIGWSRHCKNPLHKSPLYLHGQCDLVPAVSLIIGYDFEIDSKKTLVGSNLAHKTALAMPRSRVWAQLLLLLTCLQQLHHQVLALSVGRPTGFSSIGADNLPDGLDQSGEIWNLRCPLCSLSSRENKGTESERERER
uniref:Peptidase A1 domain-containing protein n=1 Tax=Macrostomum lignano TaxID=282301 RepID=A0A1I8GJE6_9PLAT